MRLFSFPSAVLGLLATAHLPSTVLAKPYPVHDEDLQQLHKNPLLAKKQQLAEVPCPAPGTSCGYYKQLCCASGQTCGTVNGQATCQAGAVGWQYFTTTWVETVGLVTYTSVGSSYVGGGSPATPTNAACSAPQSPCGSICCAGGQYCYSQADSQCRSLAGGSSGGILPTLPPGTLQPSAPLRPTSSGLVIVTFTGRPTATRPFETPIPTGAAGGNPEQVEAGGGGLSGGAIAGIVIGVLLGIFLLLLLCLFCCARALFDTFAAIFGFGKKKKHTHEETTYVEGHHSSGGAAAGRWYGARPGRPSRVGSEKKHGVGKAGGVAAALGGLALILGLKKKHDKRHDDKSTTVSGSSYYYSDYTSSSKSP